jgi:hypothetical protein
MHSYLCESRMRLSRFLYFRKQYIRIGKMYSSGLSISAIRSTTLLTCCISGSLSWSNWRPNMNDIIMPLTKWYTMSCGLNGRPSIFRIFSMRSSSSMLIRDSIYLLPYPRSLSNVIDFRRIFPSSSLYGWFAMPMTCKTKHESKSCHDSGDVWNFLRCRGHKPPKSANRGSSIRF